MTWLFILLFGQAGIGTYDLNQGKPCDSVYTFTQLTTEAELLSHTPLELVQEIMIPPLAELREKYETIVSSLAIRIVIDEEGNAIEVELLKDFPALYQEKIRNKLIEQVRWKPADLNGQSVCSEWIFYVSCIKWMN